MRLLITGGMGFIGSTLIRHILGDTEQDVINFDKLTYAANLNNLGEVARDPRYAFEHADICDSPSITQLIGKHDPDAIIHLAAETHVDRSIDSPADFVQTNVVGTSTLLEACRHHYENLSPKRRSRFRFLHVSTDEVFGSLPDTGVFSELSPYAPNSPYSASKASSDMMVRAWHRTYGLPIIIGISCNNYGPRQFPEKLIPLVILSALSGREIPIYGSGNNVRDWLFVEDHVRALVTILEHGRTGESYNVSARTELRNIDLVRLVCRTLDELLLTSPHRPHENLITFVADRPGHDGRYALDPSKIERELGWRSRVGLEDGIRRTVAWYLENRQWWRNIERSGFKGLRQGLIAPFVKDANKADAT